MQGADGKWRSLDSRALHHAAVAISEVYDDLVADHLAQRLPVQWGWRNRGERRTPAFELDGIDDRLLSEFSTRSTQVDAAMRERLVDFQLVSGGKRRTHAIDRVMQRSMPADPPEEASAPRCSHEADHRRSSISQDAR